MSDIQKQVKDLSKEREAIAVPLAIELLQFLVSNENLEKGIGILPTAEEKFHYWNNVMKNLLPNLRERNLSLKTIAYSLMLAKEALDQLSEVMNETFTEKTTYTENKMWGIENSGDLTLDKLEALEAPFRHADFEEFKKKNEKID
jgi:hypothetical protein